MRAFSGVCLRAVIFASVVSFFTATTPCRADEVAAAPRDAFLPPTALVERDADAVRPWYFGWLSFFAAGCATTTLAAFVARDPGVRIDAGVDAVRMAIGVVSTVALTPPSLFAPQAADATAPADVVRARAARRAAALAQTAAVERLGRSVLSHVGTILVNVAAAAYLGFVRDRPGSAAFALVGGIAVGELKILTQPTVAMDAPAAGWGARVEPHASVLERMPVGLSLSGAF